MNDAGRPTIVGYNLQNTRIGCHSTAFFPYDCRQQACDAYHAQKAHDPDNIMSLSPVIVYDAQVDGQDATIMPYRGYDTVRKIMVTVLEMNTATCQLKVAPLFAKDFKYREAKKAPTVYETTTYDVVLFKRSTIKDKNDDYIYECDEVLIDLTRYSEDLIISDAHKVLPFSIVHNADTDMFTACQCVDDGSEPVILHIQDMREVIGAGFNECCEIIGHKYTPKKVKATTPPVVVDMHGTVLHIGAVVLVSQAGTKQYGVVHYINTKPELTNAKVHSITVDYHEYLKPVLSNKVEVFAPAVPFKQDEQDNTTCLDSTLYCTCELCQRMRNKLS